MKEQRFPEPTVAGLIIDRDNRLLLLTSHKWRHGFVLPGGHVELGETLEHALIRELKEETNLDVYDVQFLCFQEFVYDELFWKPRHFIFFNYVCRTDSSDVVLNDEGESYLWIEVNRCVDMDVDKYTRAAIEAYLKKIF